MKKTFMIVASGENGDETDVSFVKAQDEKAALLYFVEVINDFDLKDAMDQSMANNLLEELPVGVAEFDPENLKQSYAFEWFYELPDVPDPVN